MPTGNGENPQVEIYTDSERLMTPKTDYLLTEGEESISMDFQVCQSQKTRVLCHLKYVAHLWIQYSLCDFFWRFGLQGLIAEIQVSCI